MTISFSCERAIGHHLRWAGRVRELYLGHFARTARTPARRAGGLAMSSGYGSVPSKVAGVAAARRERVIFASQRQETGIHANPVRSRRDWRNDTYEMLHASRRESRPRLHSDDLFSLAARLEEAEL